MLAVLRNPTYAKLFGAQIVALLGTGLLTIALGLLAFDIAGGDAGIVMGVAMTIKMVAYVAVSPITTALTTRLPRRTVLVGTVIGLLVSATLVVVARLPRIEVPDAAQFVDRLTSGVRVF